MFHHIRPRMLPGLAALALVATLTATLFATVLPAHNALAGKTRIFTDMVGNKLELPDPTDRIALFGGPTGQMAYLLGGLDSLVAVTSTLKTSPLALSIYPRIADLPGPRSTNGNISIETLLMANPQVVVAGDLDGSIVERKTGIPVAYLESSMGQGNAVLRREVEFYGRLFAHPERADRYLRYLDDTLALVRERTRDIPEQERVKIFTGLGPHHTVTLGGDTYMQERIELAGCLNAAEMIRTTGKREGLHSGLDQMSMELILGVNPDIVIINSGTPEEIYNAERWATVNAVKNRKVMRLPAGLFIWSRPTAESAVLFPLWLAMTAYPERFADLDIHKEFHRFYKEVCEVELSAEQVGNILTGAYESGVLKGKHLVQ